MRKSGVSIVIPTYNRALYLENCILSCLAQTVKCEIVVCDHGSTDNTPEICGKYKDEIVYVRRELDSGPHFCWLDGILHATNDLIHINYDDDWIENNFIERCLAYIKDGIGCVVTNAKVYFQDEDKYGILDFCMAKNSGIYPISRLTAFNLVDLISPAAGLFRKDILINALFIKEIPFSTSNYHGVGPDVLFSLMTSLKYKKFAFVRENLAIFRSHTNSITVDATSNAEKKKKLARAYNEARVYYFIHKIVGFLNLNRILVHFLLLRQVYIKAVLRLRKMSYKSS